MTRPGAAGYRPATVGRWRACHLRAVLVVLAAFAALSAAACGGAPEATSPAGNLPDTTTPNFVGPGTAHQTNVRITFYAAYDNDPKGSTRIDNPVLHTEAGGVGTFADPLTFASATGPGEYPTGTRIYVPLVEKYFIREDSCEVSWTAPHGWGSVTHVDLYVGNPSDSKAVLKCEAALTPDGNAPIVLDPPDSLPYDPTPIWNQADESCMQPH